MPPTTPTTSEADKARAEAQAREDDRARSGAVSGAEAVAAAVAKVANAAVDEVRKTSHVTPAYDFTTSGTPGGRITVRGNGFGPSGTLTVGGKQVQTRSWSVQEIVGDLPADSKGGEVVVHVDENTKKTGFLKV